MAAAFALPTVFGLAAAEMTYSTASAVRAHVQAAIDAATLAGASMPNRTSADDRIAKAKLVFDSNLGDFTHRFSSAENPIVSVAGTIRPTFTVTEGARVSGAASAAINFPFANLITSGPLKVTASSVAERAWSGPICMLALNSSDQGGFDLNGNAQVIAPECSGMANSDDSSAMRIVGAASANASEFGVTGGTHGSGFNPPPVEGVEPFEDPFAEVPFPPVEACVNIGTRLQQVNVVLTPGTYCEDIKIKSQSTVRFEPGIYILKDAMLKVDSDAVVTGEEVMFAFTGNNSKLWFSSGATITLSAPRSGPYAGFQFFQAAHDESITHGWATIIGGVNLEYDGIFYFPRQQIWIAGGSRVKARTSSYAMIADKLWFQDSTRTEIEMAEESDPDAVHAGRFRYGARLVE